MTIGRPSLRHAVHQRFVDVAGETGADASDRIPDIVEGAIGISSQPKIDRRNGNPIADRGGDVLNPFDTGNRVFNRFGNLQIRVPPAQLRTA